MNRFFEKKDPNKKDSLWYGGLLFEREFEYKEHTYEIRGYAVGDVIGYLIDSKGTYDRIKDKGNNGILGQTLSNCGCQSDDDFEIKDSLELEDYYDFKTDSLLQNISKPVFFLDYGNWYEIQIWDEQGRLLTEGCDPVEWEDIFELDDEDLKDFLDYYYEEV